VHDFYAHAERVIYASECEAHHGKHVLEGYGYTEVVDDAGSRLPDGEFGYLVGTSFHNRAMPMLRYRTGDVSAIIPSPCNCGSTHRRIESVSTKAEDIVVTSDGRRISPSILTHPFKPFDQIAISQIIQESATFVRVLIVARDRFTESDETSLRRALEERLGTGMRIEIERVARIPREPSGKFRWVISRVDHSCSLDWVPK
jgi:phenylacetate-CoA ligase